MNFWNKTSTWKNWQLSFLKIASGGTGLIIGAHIHHFAIDNIWWISVLTLTCITTAGIIWWKQ